MFYRTVSRFVLAGMLLTGVPALAANSSSSVFMAERCEAHQEKFSERLQNGDERKAAAESRFASRLEKLVALIDEASEAGVDTSDLDGYVKELASLREEVVVAMDALAAHWSEVVVVDCSKTTEEMADAFREEGTELRAAIREAREALKSFARETLRPEIQAIREAMQE
jgi:hypothetical protein